MLTLELAHMLVEGGNRVTIFGMADSVAPGAWFQQVRDIVPKQNKAGTQIHLGSRLTRITDRGIYVESVADKKERFYEGSMVVLSLGVKPENALVKELEGSGENVFAVGDAVKGGYIIDSTLPAFELASSLK